MDTACNDNRVLAWVVEHDVDPTHVYALDLFLPDTVVFHRFHVVDSKKHLTERCPLPEGAADKQPGGVCICEPLEVAVRLPFPAGVMAGPGHHVGEDAEYAGELAESPAS